MTSVDASFPATIYQFQPQSISIMFDYKPDDKVPCQSCLLPCLCPNYNVSRSRTGQSLCPIRPRCKKGFANTTIIMWNNSKIASLHQLRSLEYEKIYGLVAIESPVVLTRFLGILILSGLNLFCKTLIQILTSAISYNEHQWCVQRLI